MSTLANSAPLRVNVRERSAVSSESVQQALEQFSVDASALLGAATRDSLDRLVQGLQEARAAQAQQNTAAVPSPKKKKRKDKESKSSSSSKDKKDKHRAKKRKSEA